ncbi:FKBP-type peptidyl-prolyl cis-trans isomerase [Lysobacter sp. A421]
MMRFARPATALLAAASLTLAIAACQPEDKTTAETADKAADGASAETLEIKGLTTQKDQVSYMIGMDMAKSLEQIKEEIDVDTLAKAIKTHLDGGQSLMTDEQASEVATAFGERLQTQRETEAAAAAEKNKTEGTAFLAANAKKPDVKTTESGLQYQVLTEGTGPKPTVDDLVKVHYKGTLLDGETFDSSYDRGEPAVFPLQQVVPGWQEGIALMPVGSKYRFWIPGELGYGATGTPGGPIGPNAVLVFEVELQEIVQAPTE